MKDYIEQLDMLLSSGQRPLLEGAGKISHEQAMRKAKEEYRKCQADTLSPVKEEYLNIIKELHKEAKTNFNYPVNQLPVT